MSIKVVCVALLSAVTGGCGFVFTHAPPVRHYEMDYFACTENNAGPIIDLVWAGLNGLGTLAVMSDPDAYDNSDVAIGSGAVWTVLSSVAAVTGFGKTKRCRIARQELAERQAQLRDVGRGSPTGEQIVQVVVVTPAVDTIVIGERVQLVATALNASGSSDADKMFRWSSSNDAIASVNSGLVTSHASGEVVIAANANNIVGTAHIVVLVQR